MVQGFVIEYMVILTHRLFQTFYLLYSDTGVSVDQVKEDKTTLT